MARILSVDEMMIAAVESDMPGADILEAELRAFTERLAAALATHLEVEGPTEIDFFTDSVGGGVLGGFAPFTPDQPIPQVLANFDAIGEWVPRCAIEEAAHPTPERPRPGS
jgi:hypothetical protein